MKTPDSKKATPVKKAKAAKPPADKISAEKKQSPKKPTIAAAKDTKVETEESVKSQTADEAVVPSEPEVPAADDAKSEKPKSKRVQSVPAPKFQKVDSPYSTTILWAKLAIRDFTIRCELLFSCSFDFFLCSCAN